MSSNKSAQESC